MCSRRVTFIAVKPNNRFTISTYSNFLLGRQPAAGAEIQPCWSLHLRSLSVITPPAYPPTAMVARVLFALGYQCVLRLKRVMQ